MNRFGLIGRKLGHSFSPEIHACLSEDPYLLQELEPDELGPFLNRTDFLGMNVTVPYKKAVIPFCTELSDTAREIGSVNTIIWRNGGWYGDNTDAYGFDWLLRRRDVTIRGKHCAVFGSGGASATVLNVLNRCGARTVSVLSRSGRNDYAFLSEYSDTEVLVNATPVGMFPDAGNCAAPPGAFPNLEAAIDLIYNPLRTEFLLEAENMGRQILCENGLAMLVAQAVRSAELFHGIEYPEDKTTEILQQLLRRTENVVLIGMPGCGKSTVGRILSSMLKRPFLDLDEAVAEKTGKTPEDWIQSEGEVAFRIAETETLSELANQVGVVLACGGGIVTRPENRDLLRRNGKIFWIQRDIRNLEQSGRPLSRKKGSETLFRERKALYEQYADFIVNNDCSPETTAAEIMEAMEKR